MESTIRQTNSVKFELDMALTKEELNPYLQSAYREAQKHANRPGFRKGHVPITLIKQLYGASLDQEAQEEAVQKEFAKLMEEKEIRPIGQPAITKLDRTDEGGLAFTVSYEVLPTVEITDYKGLPARRIFHVVGDDEIEIELQRIRESHAKEEEEPAESVADENHAVKLTMQKLENGEPVEGNVMNDVPVFLARHDINPELKASLLNTKVGDSFRIDLPTGEDNALNNYEVTVVSINRMTVPEIDDQFAVQLLGKEDGTVDDLRHAVRQGISSEYDKRYSGYFRDALINALIERNPFEVPDAFVGEVLRSFIEDMKRGPKKELPPDFDMAKFITETRPMAEHTAKWALLRDMVIDKEDLQADDSDYEGLAEIESQRTGIDVETLLNYFRKSDKIRDRILAEKAIQFLEDYAVIEDVEDRTIPAPEPHTHDHDHDHDHEHSHDHDHEHHDHEHHDHEHHDH